jgi:hypothetical protein
MPAGHRSALVRSWLNPRSILTFRESRGTSTWPLGVIQSRMGPLRLLVSSPQVPEAPFRIYKRYDHLILAELGLDAHQVRGNSHLIIRARHETFFESWYKLEKLLKYLMLASLSEISKHNDEVSLLPTHSAVKCSAG